jgi:tellurite resistance protein
MQHQRSGWSALEHLSFAWFVPVMGWTGLGLSWSRAIDGLGEPAYVVATVCASLASGMLALVLLAMLWRAQAHSTAYFADLRHPIKHTFVAALPIGMVLLAALWIGLTHRTPLALEVFWWVGALAELATTVWVLSRWLRPADQGGTPLAALTPVIFLPLVGNLLVAWAGMPLGHGTWSAIQAGIGAMMWPMALAALVVRQFQVGPLPPRMTPTWFIMIVPPSALALSINLWEPPPAVLWAIWGMALLSFMWALTQVKSIVEQPFGMPHWSLSFPLTAFTSATLMQAHSADGGWLWAPGVAVLAITSAVIVWLSRMTLRGLWHGDLLRPE